MELLLVKELILKFGVLINIAAKLTHNQLHFNKPRFLEKKNTNVLIFAY